MKVMKNLAYGIVGLAAMSAANVFAAGTLPSGYTEIEYIESSGTQYINTGIAPKTTTRLVLDFCMTSTAGGQWNGWGSSGNKESFFLGVDSSGNFKVSVSGNWTKSDTGVAIDTARHTFDISPAALKLDGNTFANASTSPFSNAASGKTLYLFAMRQGWLSGSDAGAQASMRLYSCQIYDGETLVRDFVPAVNGSNVAGLYDTVTKTFFGNSGSGSFVAGDEVVHPFLILPIPDQSFADGPCRPEFIVSNVLDATTCRIGGDIVSSDFDVVYTNNESFGVATVTAIAKGEFAGEVALRTFAITEDENISTSDTSVKRHIVDGKYVYVFTNAASAQVVTAKRNLAMTDCLLVGGGGAGGGKTGGGGGAGGVTNATNLGTSAFVAKTGSFALTVGAGGTHNNNPQSKGGNGGATSLVFGEFSASVSGGGGGGSWNNAIASAGASGGGGAQNGAGGAGTDGIGYAGATGLGVNTCRSGGGGGAGHAGYQADTTANHSGYGGEGVSNNITGAWVVYGGGGGGGGGKGSADSTTLTPGLGGLGGGGDGGSSANNGNGNPGTDGLGGGGGGGNISGNGNNGGRGGQGGSGTVILAVKPNGLEVDLTDQLWESFDPCRPVFTVSNSVNGAYWTVGGDSASEYFDVEYINNVGVGTARVDITGKGDCAGLGWSGYFNITATKYEDANISTADLTAKRIEVDGRYIYIFTNTVSAQTVTANRMIALDEFLLVGGGGGGGRTRAGGGGGGGVTNAAGVVGVVLRKNETFSLAVGAGGAGGVSQSTTGGKGGDTALEFGLFAVTVPGGGGGAGWDVKTGAKGGSGGGGANGGGGGAGINGFGFAGAASLGGNNRSGGGGGAGHVGYQGDTTANRSGNGGEGVSNRITGAWVYYGGGGGAGGSNNGYYNPAGGFGGLGGGGDGSTGIDGNPGTDGLGGGGGGGGYGGGPSGYSSAYSGSGGKGGSGIAILAIKATDFAVDPIPDQILAGGISEPLPVVRTADGGTLLVKDEDYTVSYRDNDKGGMAIMTITGINGCAGKSIELFFKITARIYAKPSVASEGDGTSWANAMSVAKAFETLANASGYNEIWMQSGTVSQPAFSIANSGVLAIRGGFAGTETTLEERQPGAFTVFNGENTATALLSVSDTLDAETVVDRVKFYRAKNNGLVKTGGGNLRVYDCLVEANGSGVNKVWGRGMNVQSDGNGSLVVSNCVFAGNRCTSTDTQYGGFGLYVKSFREAVVDNSLFVTNGYDIRRAETPSSGGWDYCGMYSKGSAALVIDTPITVKNSRFAGNCCPLRKSLSNDAGSGGALTLTGASGGSRVENCVFVGNIDRRSQGMEGDAGTGALALYLNSASAKVAVDNCTFAYNITAGSKSAAGITILKGSADIKNTIFWKNRRYYMTTIGYGADVQVQADGSASISHSLVTDLDGSALSGANLTVDADTVFSGDPKLVTTTADFEGQLTYTDTTVYYDYTRASRYEDLASIDAHLLSQAGYVVNGGAAGPATASTSPAIDLGDPEADYSNEPTPNGGRLNLGAYGNTAEASLSPTGQPEAVVAVVFPDGEARPAAQVTMGLESGDGYLATVHVICSTNGVTLAEETFHQVVNGDVLELKSPSYLPSGTVFAVAVTVDASGAESRTYNVSQAVSGTYPPFYGKGGGPNVIHVRTGADGLQDGSNWEHAYPNLRAAFASVPGASKTEVWLSVTNDYLDAAMTLDHSLVFRGGFTGAENSPAERPEGLRALLDGGNYYKTMQIAVPSEMLLTVERIHFSHSGDSELKKTGAGDLTVRDCWFTDSKTSDEYLNGRGINASGGTVTVTNCWFLNLLSGSQASGSYRGCAFVLTSCTQAYVDDCLFVTNGMSFGATHPGWFRHSAAAAYINATPAIFRNCRFAACCACNYEQSTTEAGAVYFYGASSGSKLVNCVFTGNGDVESGNTTLRGIGGGAINCAMANQSDTLDIENCTIAFNLTEGLKAAGGINVNKGTVNLKNSIVYGNVRGRPGNFAGGSDIDVKAGATLNISYSLVTGTTTNYIGNAGGEGIINWGAGILTDDPLLVSTTNNLISLLATKDGLLYIPASATATVAAFDVHPRTRTGYMLDGVLIRDPENVESPTTDAGDPKSDYSNEPNIVNVGYNGHRVNLGAYGNTSEAALTKPKGFVFSLR